MDLEKDQIEHWFQERLSRREALKRTAEVSAALSAGSLLIANPLATAFAKGPDVVRWISPRGTLDVMDDFNLWVGVTEGFFAKHNIKVELAAGPNDAFACTKFVAQGTEDMGYPSPGVLTSSIDGGIGVISAWEMIAGQVFDFSLPRNSKIKHPQQLAGKTIALGSPGWSVIVDPILVEVGVHPKSVHYVTAYGSQWSEAVAQGKVDAGLAWEGLRGQLLGQGLKLKFLIGNKFSKGPSNSYSIRKADLGSKHMRDVYTRFFMGMVEAFEFTKANPRASAQITYTARPNLAATLSPQLALDSMMELASGYSLTARRGLGYGYHYASAWKSYLQVVHKLGQTTKLLTPREVLTNRFVGPANAGAHSAAARTKGKHFKLDAAFAATKIPPHNPL
jgi:NitT/TauT family transport system substrate-binding protein